MKNIEVKQRYYFKKGFKMDIGDFEKQSYYNYEADDLGFIYSDEEIGKRITTALQHLTYLSKLKREDERKASGSKF